MTIDQDKLGELLGRFVGDLGATSAAGNVVVGHRLGLYPQPWPRGRPPRRSWRGGPEPTRGSRGVAARAGGGRVRQLRSRRRAVLADRGAGVRAGRPGWGAVPAGRVPARAGRAAGRVADHRRVPVRRRDGLARAPRGRVRRVIEMFFRPGYVANLTSSWIPALDGVGGEAGRRRPGGRRRLRPRGVDRAAGPGLPHGRDRRLGLPPGVRGHRAQARRRGRAGRPGPVRGRVGADVLRDRVRPRRHLRLPARHGRPGRRGPAHQAGGRRGRHLADRRAGGRRHAGGEPQPGEPGLLLVLHVHLRAGRPLAARRVHAGLPGRGGRHPRGHVAGRVQPVPPGQTNPVQRRLRSPS